MYKTMLRRLRLVHIAVALLVLTVLPRPLHAESAVSDLNDDGVVNVLDLFQIIGRLGTQAGEVGYREGLDLVPDGVIDVNDYLTLIPNFAQPAAISPTSLTGRVFDGIGNPLPGVTVLVGPNLLTDMTDQNGVYLLDIPVGETGDTVITFDGSTAVDPTPGFLSGQYPTIPNKPIFINGGTDNVFRAMSLPERDLVGSVDLSAGGVATNTGNNTWVLNEDVGVRNAGVKLDVPAGCEVNFPDGEDPVLSITRVDPARLPVPMPPTLSSSLFVTYQPGGTEINCPASVALFTEFDNDDGFPNGPGNLQDGPFLAGITNGVFQELAACEVSGALEGPTGFFTGGTVRCGPIPLPFDFAWYHSDIRPPTPCPRTTVVGTVRLNDVPMTPVSGATVSVPGVGPVSTVADGTFSIPNVPAGPNGTRCFVNPFSIRASASKGADLGVSQFTPAVSGGLTDVRDIKFGISGVVQGQVIKLTSVDPFVVTPLAGTDISVDSLPSPGCCAVTDVTGRYSVFDVPSGPYFVEAFFAGLLPEPGGGVVFKQFSGFQEGSIDFDGAIQVQDFRFTGTGTVEVQLLNQDGTPAPFIDVALESLGGGLGGGFVAPNELFFGFANHLGQETFEDVPQGPCEITVTDFDSETEDPIIIATLGPEDGCFVNQHGQVLDLTVTLPNGNGT